jgi:plasmid stability protein
MPAFVIRNLPPTLHQRLKEQAAKRHRSMNQEAIVLLEQALVQRASEVQEAPPPYRGAFALTQSFIDQAKRTGRA